MIMGHGAFDEIAEVVGTVAVLCVVFGWLVWSRWLSHRETMKLTEAGGGSRAALQLRERWRVRRGLLGGCALLLVGGAILAVSPNLGLIRPALWEPEFIIGVAGALIASIGVVMIVAYAMWSRRDVGVLALGLLGDEKTVVDDAGGDGEEQSGAGEETEGETRG